MSNRGLYKGVGTSHLKLDNKKVRGIAYADEASAVPSLAQLRDSRGVPSYTPLDVDFPWEPIRGIGNITSPNTRIMAQGVGNAMLSGKATEYIGGQSDWLIIGDSITAGAISSVGVTSFDRLRSWPMAMRDQMANGGIPANGTGMIRITDSGNADARVIAATGSWTGQLHASRATTNTTTATWLPDQSGTVVDFHYYDDAASMVFTIAIEGATSGTNFLSVTTVGGNTWKRARLFGVDVKAYASEIKFSLTTAGAGLLVSGLDVWTPNGGLRVHNLGQSGSSASGSGNGGWVATINNVFKDVGGRRRALTDVSSTSGSSTLTSATGAFTTDDLGKSIDQFSPGSGGYMFDPGSYIGAILSGTTVRMDVGNGYKNTPSLARATLSSQSIYVGRDPSCVHIGLGLNDLISLGASDITITNAIATLRATYPNSDCILHLNSEAAPSLVPTARFDSFQKAMYKLAKTLNVPIYDWRDRVGNFAQGQAVGVYGDNSVHITPATSSGVGADMAAVVGSGSGPSQTKGDPLRDNDTVPFWMLKRWRAKSTAVPATTTVETVVARLGPFPANDFQLNDEFRYEGSLKPAATSVITVRIRVGPTGTTSDSSVVTMSATAATNANRRTIKGAVWVLSTGAAAVVLGSGQEGVDAIIANGTQAATSGTFNTTQRNYVSLTVQNTSSTTTQAYVTLERV